MSHFTDNPAGSAEGRPCFEIRPLDPDDRERYIEAFDGLSERSRLRRFGSPKPRLTSGDLRYLLDIDHHGHEALAAVDCDDGHLLAIGRFVQVEGPCPGAEIAIEVLDEWQGHGMARPLLERLFDRARQEGVGRLTAEVMPDNVPAIKLLRELGFTARPGRSTGLAHFEAPARAR